MIVELEESLMRCHQILYSDLLLFPLHTMKFKKPGFAQSNQFETPTTNISRNHLLGCKYEMIMMFVRLVLVSEN